MLEFTPKDTDPKSMNEAVHDNWSAMRGCAGDLNHLAQAFRTTGNKELAERLFHIAEVLEDQGEIISVAWAKQVGEMVRESEQSMFNTVNAALAGLAIGARETAK